MLRDDRPQTNKHLKRYSRQMEVWMEEERTIKGKRGEERVVSL